MKNEKKEQMMERIKDEGSLKVFMHRGYVCVVLRAQQIGIEKDSSLIHLCGYVGLPKGHPFYGWDYVSSFNSGVYPPCHGGVTYSAGRLVTDSNLWFIGFDCAHSGDICSLLDLEAKYRIGTDTYKDMNYVTVEVKRLAEWLRGKELKGARS